MNTPEENSVEIHDLSVSYDGKPVLWNIDITLPQSKLIAIVGPNGAGKTTLIKAILGLLPLDSGYVKILGQSIHNNRRQISYMCQTSQIDWDFPISVHELVMMGRYPYMGILKRPSKQDKQKVQEALHQVDMFHMADKQIGKLSGGQRQRILLARTLVQNAPISLMDEPFNAVDAATEILIIKTLKNMIKQGKTIIVVHHDLDFVKTHFDWAILLNTRLITAGPIQQALHPDLLKKTYGAQLPILQKVLHLIKEKDLPTQKKTPT